MCESLWKRVPKCECVTESVRVRVYVRKCLGDGVCVRERVPEARVCVREWAGQSAWAKVSGRECLSEGVCVIVSGGESVRE